MSLTTIAQLVWPPAILRSRTPDGRIKDLLAQQEKIGQELAALREQAAQELEAFSTPKRKRRTKAELATEEKRIAS